VKKWIYTQKDSIEKSQRSFRRESRYPHLTIILRGQWGGGGKDESGHDDKDAREISHSDAPHDSPRLFAESEEVCRYKYNAFSESSARARCHQLAQWHLKSSIVDALSRHARAIRTRILTSLIPPPTLWFRSVRTRRKSTWFRVEWSTDRLERVSWVSLSNQLDPRRSRSRLLFLQTAAFRREWHTSSKNWKVRQETKKLNVTSNLNYSPFKELGIDLEVQRIEI